MKGYAGKGDVYYGVAEISWEQGGSGNSHVVTASPAPALQLVSSSSSKSFYRVDEPRTWKEAMWYCQEHYTDLADLQSMNSPVSIMDVYSYTSNTQAWIGLFYDVRISGLRWSSGSIFTTPTWTVLPVFQDGICATLYSLLMAPVLGAASCTAKKPFICYYGVFRLIFWACSLFSKIVLGRGERKRSVCVSEGNWMLPHPSS